MINFDNMYLLQILRDLNASIKGQYWLRHVSHGRRFSQWWSLDGANSHGFHRHCVHI